MGEEKAYKFIPNKGQWDSKVLFKADVNSGSLFLEKNRFTYSFHDNSAIARMHRGETVPENEQIIRYHNFRINFENASAEVNVSGSEKSTEYYNYFLGNDRSKWASGIHAFKKITYDNLYNKIDLKIYTGKELLKYDFVISAGGNPSAIKMKYEGVEKIFLRNGELVIKTSVNEIIEQKPYAYQIINGKKKEVKCSFVLASGEVSFHTGNFDKSIPLIIDPVLVFASYSGSSADNFGMTATYDNAGNFYAGGTAFNNGYPITMGAFQTNFSGITGAGITDVVITKYNSSGTSLIYSTYLGGSGTETVNSLIVNNNDELFLYGATSSSDFPVTSNAYDTSFNGGIPVNFPYNGTNFSAGTDIYVAKFNAFGTSLIGSTFIGGSDNDGLNTAKSGTYYNNIAHYDSLVINYGDQLRGEIMIDDAGNCYVASSTRSADFPVINGFQDTLSGSQDAVIIKFNGNLTSLLWSTYLGGSDKDAAYSVKVDSLQNVYVAGGTCSADFPADSNSVFSVFQGGATDGFVAKISANGSALLNASFIGTSAYDQTYFVELDKNANVYIVGQTLGNFPVINAVYSVPNSPQYITKLTNNLDSIIYSTVFGNGNLNSVNISPSAFLVDDCENVYVSGWGANILLGTGLSGMPTTSNALFQNSPNGFDFYLINIGRDASSLLYGTYFGGGTSREHVDGGTSRFDKRGMVYQSVCAGCGGNSDFPTSGGVWSNSNNSSNCNNGTFKFDFQIVPIASSVSSSSECGSCTGTASIFGAGGVSPYTFLWDSAAGNSTDTLLSGLCTGTYSVTVSDFVGCSSVNQVTIPDTSTLAAFTAFYNPCENACTGEATCIATGGISPYSFLWSDSSATATATGLCAGTYTVTVTDSGGCQQIQSVTLTAPPPFVFTNITASNNVCADSCNGSVSVAVSGGNSPYSYLWNDPSASSSPSVSNLCAGNYTVTITDNNNCITDTTLTISEPPVITSTAVKTNETCYLYCNGAAAVSANGGIAPYSFLWSNSSISDSIFNLCPGTYMVSISDSNGCMHIDSVTINAASLFLVNSNSTNNTDCLNCNGTASASPAGGAFPFSFLWSTGSQNTNVNGLCAGTYTVTITDANSCNASQSVNVSDTSSLALSISDSVNLLCNSICSGEVVAAVSGGESPYIYEWSNGQADDTASALCAGNYLLTITDANNCKRFASVNITEPPALFINPPVTSNPDCNGVCNGSAGVSAFGGVLPYSYLWSNNATSVTITGLCANTYSVTVTDNNGCAVSSFVNIAEPPVLTAATTGTNISCNGFSDGAAILSANGGTSPYTILWNTGDTTAPISGLPASVYTVTVTDANGCQKTTSITITEPSLLIASSTANPASCQNSADGSAAITPSGGTSPYFFLWSTGEQTQNISSLPVGDYSVTITDNNGCDTAYFISISDTSTLQIVSSFSNPACFDSANGTASASANGGTAPYSYLWSTLSSFQTLTGLASGIYYITVTDANNCTRIDSVELIAPAQLMLSNISSTDVTCFGDSNGTAIVAAAGGTPPYSYVWSDSQNSAFAENLASGTYSVTATDNNGCETTATTAISQPPPLVSAAESNAPSCFNVNDGSASVSVSGGTPITIGASYNYLWSNGEIFSHISNLNPQTYIVTITDNNNCTKVDTIIVSSATFSPQTISLSADTTIIPLGGNTVLHAVFDNSANFQWFPAAGLNSATAANPTASPTQTTTYSFIVSDPANASCFYSDTITIFVYETICGEPDIFVANAFTPNNDNYNDVVFVRGNNILKMYFVIYDRWGDKIFETENQTFAWDGTYKGMKCDPAVYVYYLTVTCIDEQEFFKKGNITLIR